MLRVGAVWRSALLVMVAAGCQGALRIAPPDGGDSDGGSSCASSCATPPSAFCVDGTTLRRYSATGICAFGQCAYGHTDVVCGGGCQGGACVGDDPCAAVSCDAPPAPSCSDADTLLSHASDGTCAAGMCSYASLRTQCASGCSGAACVNDPCAGLACDRPPAPVCANANTLRTFAPSGCSGGACQYPPTDTPCAHGCVGGACAGDPCAGVTCNAPPAPTCASGARRTYAATGTCHNGACSYTSSDMSCAHGCSAGMCVGDPCAGVTCNVPPAAYCVNPTTARKYAATGTCGNGTCTYASTDTPCANGCSGGACAPDPCASVTCNTPPAPTCIAGYLRVTASATGTCSGNGVCTYTYAQAPCAFGCSGGACAANPCAAGGGTKVPGDAATVQAAVSGGSGVVCLAGQAFAENVTVGKTTTIVGAGPSTTLDGLIVQGATAFVSNLKLTGKNSVYVGKSSTQPTTSTAVLSRVDATQASGFAIILQTSCEGTINLAVLDSYLHDSSTAIYDDGPSGGNGCTIDEELNLWLLGDTFANNGYGFQTYGALGNNTFESGNVTVENTLFVNNKYAAISAPRPTVDVIYPWFQATWTYDHNAFSGNGATYQIVQHMTPGAGDVTADPQLDTGTPPAPKSTSPLRGAGNTAALTATDYFGSARTSPDIGAVNAK